MNILITGASGFIGKNLINKLNCMNNKLHTVFEYNSSNSLKQLKEYAKNADFIFHFAAVHRPKDEYDFFNINVGLTKELINFVEEFDNKCPILFTSSIQVNDDSLYGKSKLECERLIVEHSQDCKSISIIYRLSNTFGKWAAPHYHSVVATFCHNLSKDLPIYMSNPNHLMCFHYIEEVVDNFIEHLTMRIPPNTDGYYSINEIYNITLKDLHDTLMCFKNNDYCNIDMNMEINKKLFETYVSYADDNDGI